VIRPLVAGDFDAWREAHRRESQPRNRWDVWALEAASLTRAKFRALLRGQRVRRRREISYHLAVFLAKTGECIGGVSVMDVIRNVSQSAYLGYAIRHRHWGAGYGKEAVRAAFDIAFRDLRLHRLEAGVEPGNVRSIRLARSLGMRREGLKRRCVHLRGEWLDLVAYAITCEELGMRFRGRAD